MSGVPFAILECVPLGQIGYGCSKWFVIAGIKWTVHVGNSTMHNYNHIRISTEDLEMDEFCRVSFTIINTVNFVETCCLGHYFDYRRNTYCIPFPDNYEQERYPLNPITALPSQGVHTSKNPDEQCLQFTVDGRQKFEAYMNPKERRNWPFPFYDLVLRLEGGDILVNRKILGASSRFFMYILGGSRVKRIRDMEVLYVTDISFNDLYDILGYIHHEWTFPVDRSLRLQRLAEQFGVIMHSVNTDDFEGRAALDQRSRQLYDGNAIDPREFWDPVPYVPLSSRHSISSGSENDEEELERERERGRERREEQERQIDMTRVVNGAVAQYLLDQFVDEDPMNTMLEITENVEMVEIRVASDEPVPEMRMQVAEDEDEATEAVDRTDGFSPDIPNGNIPGPPVHVDHDELAAAIASSSLFPNEENQLARDPPPAGDESNEPAGDESNEPTTNGEPECKKRSIFSFWLDVNYDEIMTRGHRESITTSFAKWDIYLYEKVLNGHNFLALGIYLGDLLPFCNYDGKIRIEVIGSEGKIVSKVLMQMFNQKNCVLGYPNFMPWGEVLDMASGGPVTVAMYVTMQMTSRQLEKIRYDMLPGRKDVMVEVEGVALPVSRDVLSHASPVWKKMFDSTFIFNRAKVHVIDQIGYDHLNQILEILYNKGTTFERSDVEPLLEQATRFEIQDVIDYLCREIVHSDEFRDREIIEIAKKFKLRRLMYMRCNRLNLQASDIDRTEPIIRRKRLLKDAENDGLFVPHLL